MRTPFTGCGTALVTPFTSSGAVDEAAVRRLARRQIEAGVHFLVPCGTTGEAPTLSAGREAPRGRARGRGGAGPRARPRRRRRLRHARGRRVGARDARRPAPTACSRSRPYYNKPTPEGLVPALPGDRGGDAAARSSSTTCPGGPAATWTRRPSSRLAAIPHVAGVKEASGNMTQICEVLKAVPPGFIVLSGRRRAHAARDGGRRARRHLGRVERGPGGDGAARGGGRGGTTSPPAREIHARLLPLMLANFAESNPIPVKAAMAQMGLLEESYRLPMVPPQPPRRARSWRACSPRPGSSPRRRARERLARPAGADRGARRRGERRRAAEEARAAFAELRAALSRGEVRAAEPDAVRAHGLARERLGQAGHPARLPPRRPRATRRWTTAAGRSSTRTPCPSSASTSRPACGSCPGGSAVRDGAFLGPRGHRHAPDVRQHRRVRGRGLDDRLARARRLLRAGRPARPRQRRGADRRRARAGRARCR